MEVLGRIAGAEMWVKEYEEGKITLLLGRREDVNREVMDEIDRCVRRGDGEVVGETQVVASLVPRPSRPSVYRLQY